MQAMVISKHGGPDVLQYTTLDVPSPKAGEVLLRVLAVGVNRLDALLRQGDVFRVPLPHIPGTDVVGEIEAVGVGVKGLSPGDNIMVAPILSCGSCEQCLAGEDNRCESFGTVGSSIPGGYAEYMCLPARNAVRLPADMPIEEAAAFPLTYATATSMLRRADLKAGETVLVQGATGGLGTAGVQIAKAMGAVVIAVVRSEATRLAARQNGADHVVHSGALLSEDVRAITGGRGVHVAFEHVGGATFEQSLSSLRTDGKMVVAGVTSGTSAAIDLKAVFLKRLSIIGCRGSGRNDLLAALELWKTGKIHPIVKHVLPLEQAAQAHRLLDDAPHTGRIILKP